MEIHIILILYDREATSTVTPCLCSRLLAQLDETENAFEQFWSRHHLKLEQCLQLRHFEHDFREVGLPPPSCTCCPPDLSCRKATYKPVCQHGASGCGCGYCFVRLSAGQEVAVSNPPPQTAHTFGYKHVQNDTLLLLSLFFCASDPV